MCYTYVECKADCLHLSNEMINRTDNRTWVSGWVNVCEYGTVYFA